MSYRVRKHSKACRQYQCLPPAQKTWRLWSSTQQQQPIKTLAHLPGSPAQPCRRGKSTSRLSAQMQESMSLSCAAVL